MIYGSDFGEVTLIYMIVFSHDTINYIYIFAFIQPLKNPVQLHEKWEL